MSLTSFIKIPEVKERFAKEFPIPFFNLKSPLLCPPRTNHYGLIGTAFDYLLRFYLKTQNTQATANEWVAELGVELTKDSPKLFKKTSSLLQQAKEIYENYLKTEEMNEEVIKAAIYLAQLDPIYRAGVVDPNLGVADKEDIEDLKSLLKIVKLDNFKAKKVCVLNPTFGEASHLVGGADADLLIDDTLIDVKTIKNLEINRDNFNQLIGYYILFKIGGIDQWQEDLEIKNLGIYFSRYGILFTIPVDTILNTMDIKDFTKWLKKKAKEHFPD